MTNWSRDLKIKDLNIKNYNWGINPSGDSKIKDLKNKVRDESTKRHID